MSSGSKSALRSSGSKRFFVAAQLAERLAQQVAGPAVAVDQRPAPLQRAERVLQHAELGVALGFFDRSAQKYAVECHAKSSVELTRLKRKSVPQHCLPELYSAVWQRQMIGEKKDLKSASRTTVSARGESFATHADRTGHGVCTAAIATGNCQPALNLDSCFTATCDPFPRCQFATSERHRPVPPNRRGDAK